MFSLLTRRKIKGVVTRSTPNIITLINLALGFVAIKSAFNENFELAVALIISGMFLDCLDGAVARKLDVTSDFGKELDSLSDMVSFGVAPAVLCWLILPYQTILFEVCLVIFVVCGACRLAEFNSIEKEFTCFKGFPVTAGGGLLAILGLYESYIPFTLFIIIVVTLSASMVSKIPFFSLKSKKQLKLTYLAFLIPAFPLILYYPYLLALILGGYLLSGIVIYIGNTFNTFVKKTYNNQESNRGASNRGFF